MEERKISLSTLLLILLIITICAMGFFIYKLNGEKMTATQEVTQLNNQINSLENTVATLQEKVDNTLLYNNVTETETEVNKPTNNITNISDIQNLLKNNETYEYLKIQDIKEDNDKYLVEADYYVPTPITEKQYSEMVKNKKITLKNNNYIFENSNNTYGYVYMAGEVKESGYEIEKTKDGYIFISETGGFYNIINEIKEHYTFYLDKNTEVYEIAGNNEVFKLSNYLSKNENKNFSNFLAKVVLDADNNKLIIDVDKR